MVYKTLFLEYLDDKFTPNNEFKHSLGQLLILGATNKKEKQIEEKVTIIDFNKCNGRPMSEVLTLWGDRLIDFHKKLFDAYGIKKEDLIFYDESDWLKRNGGSAENYYEKDLLLYMCHGILFENFLLTGQDGEFARNVFLPSFEKALNAVGVKPLIVPIPPMDMEEDSVWFSYDKKIKTYIKLN